MKSLILVSIVVLNFSNLFSQSFEYSIGSGISFSSLTPESKLDDKSLKNPHKPAFGLNLTTSVTYHTKKSLIFSSGIDIINTNVSELSKFKNRFWYISIPFEVAYKFTSTFNVGIGIRYEYLLRLEYTGANFSQNLTYLAKNRHYVNPCLSLRYKPLKKISISITSIFMTKNIINTVATDDSLQPIEIFGARNHHILLGLYYHL